MIRQLPLSLLASLCFALSPAGGAAPSAPSTAAHEAAFDPMKFFTGKTQSWGIFENRSVEPTEQIVTKTQGRLVGKELQMEQELYFGSKPAQHRSWKMRRIDAHHFAATANDIVGTVIGESRGNAFSWTFTLALKPGNPLFNVRMTQRMYLQPDGRTMINRDTVRKFGIIVTEVTEQFRRL